MVTFPEGMQNAAPSETSCEREDGATSFKPSEFNIVVESFFPEWTIHYNSFTGAFLVLDRPSTEAFAQTMRELAGGQEPSLPDWKQTAASGGYAVSVARDERAEIVRNYRQSRAASNGLALTIAPTVNCNFGCTYCFQQHSNRRMSQEDMSKLVSFADKHLAPNTGLYITWFGGEPLAALPVLRTIGPKLRDLAASRGCAFRHAMITNGYLLTEDAVDLLVSFGAIDYIQITLDGPPAYHDTRRPLRNGRGTFDRILKNVCMAVDRVPITIRVNVDKRNSDGLDGLLDTLIAAGLRGRVGVYLGHTEAYTDVCSSVAEHSFSRQEYAALESRFKFVLLQRGWFGRIGLPRPRGGGGQCIADNLNGFVVAPESLVFKCWNEVAETADQSTATIGADGALSSLTTIGQQWRDFDPFFHEPCRTCRVQPLCRGGCPWESRKNLTSEPGHCSPLRWSLEETLKLHHLESVLTKSLA